MQSESKVRCVLGMVEAQIDKLVKEPIAEATDERRAEVVHKLEKLAVYRETLQWVIGKRGVQLGGLL